MRERGDHGEAAVSDRGNRGQVSRCAAPRLGKVEPLIPKTLFQTSRHRLPPYLRDEMSKHLSPEWEYKHFVDDDILLYFAENPIAEFADIAAKFHVMPSGPLKSDLFRYYYLYRHGGVFIDSDAVLKAPLDEIVEGVDFFTVRSGYLEKTVFQGFIGCTAGNALMHRALTDAYLVPVVELKKFEHLLCANLYEFIEKYSSGHRIRMLDEIAYNNGVCEIIDRNGKIVLMHYFASETVPKSVWDTRLRAPAAAADSSPEALLERAFALARAGELPPDLYALVFDKLMQSGNGPLLQAFARLRAA